jgi:hypothetical protein
VGVDDFRSKRIKLPREVFAYAPGPERDPSDLIDERTWRGVVFLPDDVSVRTSDHHGELLRAAHDVWGHWTGLVLDVQSLVVAARDDPLALACLVVTDELQASIYAVLTGFYRQSIAGLRSALDAIVAGAYFRALPNPDKFAQWADGQREGQLWMRDVRKQLSKVEPYRRFEASAHDRSESSRATLLGRSGWLNFLYAHLSGFSHGRPFYVGESGNRLPSSNVELWGGSNGPVYEPRSVRLWSRFYFDVALVSLLLVGLADTRLLTLTHPADIHYAEFLKRTLAWHFGPPPVARDIVSYLTS